MSGPSALIDYASFIDRFGYIKYYKNISRKYPRDATCEICDVTSEYLLAVSTSFGYGGNSKGLVFDHCHKPEHWWVRGRLCGQCNGLMRLFDNGLLWPGAPWYTACAEHYCKCPDCDYEHLPQLIDRNRAPSLTAYYNSILGE